MRYNKINIFLRAFDRNRLNPDRPSWFNYEKCFLNLLKTLNHDFCNLTVCFEGDLSKSYIAKYRNQFKFNIIETCASSVNDSFEDASWSRSLADTCRRIERQGLINDDGLIYILEDDYLHRPLWSEAVLDLFNYFIGDNAYVCLYDHFDKYLFVRSDKEPHWGMYKDLKSSIIVSNACHWRSVPNCGLSMIITPPLWERDSQLWTDGLSDCEIGFRVTQLGTKIYTPMPAFSTHCINPFVAPLVNWEKIINV